MRVSVNLDTLYAAWSPVQRFAAAAADGVTAVEMWAPDRSLEEACAAAAVRAGTRVVVVNTTAGPGVADFGELALPERIRPWRAEFARTLDFARACHAGAINVLVGGRLAAHSRAEQLDTAARNLAWALSGLGADDPSLLIEPLNGVDRRSPVISDVASALALIDSVGAPDRLRILFDAYHLFQEERSLLETLRGAYPIVGHVQLADFPGRNEPGTGRIPVAALLTELNRYGYGGHVGLEYVPSGSEPPLAWLQGSAGSLLSLSGRR